MERRSLEKTYKVTEEYNANKQPTTQVLYVWDELQEIWVPGSRTITNYTSTQKVSSYISAYWIEQNTVWYEDSKTDYEYDDNDSTVLAERFRKIGGLTDGVWEPFSLDSWDYNETGTLLFSQTKNGYNSTTNSWIYHRGYEYICTLLEDETASVEDIEQVKTSIYPNPITGHQLTIKTEEPSSYSLISHFGSTVMQGELTNGLNTIGINKKLSNGIYFLQLGNSTQKIIINR